MKARAVAGLRCCDVWCSLRAAIFEVLGFEGILNTGRDVRAAVAGILRMRTLRIVESQGKGEGEREKKQLIVHPPYACCETERPKIEVIPFVLKLNPSSRHVQRWGSRTGGRKSGVCSGKRRPKRRRRQRRRRQQQR